MKKCPYCAEEIQDAAIFCRYCQHDLRMLVPQPSAPVKQPDAFSVDAPLSNLVPCPSCGTRISPNSYNCPHCSAVVSGALVPPVRDLPLAPVAPSASPAAPPQVPIRPRLTYEPSPWISLLLAVCLLLAIYGVAIGIGISWYGSATDLQSLLGLYQLGVMFIVTLFAVPGLDPERRGCLRYVGIFILSIIPIVGWVVLYWAGKGIARAFAGRSS